MSKILVIGARGRAGRAAIEEARRRGHEVTGVARRSPELTGVTGVTGSEGGAGDGELADRIRTGDVTDAAGMAILATGHDAVVAAVYDGSSDPSTFFPAAARALVSALEKAAVPRLIWVGLASILPTANGVLLMDRPGYPQEYRPFYLAHQTVLDIFRSSGLDWVSIAPAGDFDHTEAPRGSYQVAPADATAQITYADLAVALIDEIDHPTHHATAIGVV
ncbi:NAD(P)H-binding protein [Kribbella sp. NPDC026611]|uniref:NAD(P)-dependent oxidoreductase n=1 Tax=Kribbella sp. NPDC026611 TaxID=3154911 RepID=UPI0033C44034